MSETLLGNDCPIGFLNQLTNNVDNSFRTNNSNSTPQYISAPYTPQTSERVHRIFEDRNIKFSNNASKTLFNKLSNAKQKITIKRMFRKIANFTEH